MDLAGYFIGQSTILLNRAYLIVLRELVIISSVSDWCESAIETTSNITICEQGENLTVLRGLQLLSIA